MIIQCAIEQKELGKFLASWDALACDPYIKNFKFSINSSIPRLSFPVSLSMRYSGSTTFMLMSHPNLDVEFVPVLEIFF